MTETPANSRRSQASSATAPKAGDSKSNPLLTATLQKTSWDCIRITRRVNIYTWKMLKLLKSHFTLYEIERLIAAGGERFPV
ncbi:hypothetical protein CapIbe_008187 [Capra ibex]